MKSRTIVVTEDEPEVRAVLRAGLEAEGWLVVEAADRAQLMRAVDAGPVDLVTLDLRLGKEDGLGIARHLRARRNVPIIMITGRAEPFDRVTGLENGADDYIVKPFLVREVVLRIRQVLDRYSVAPPRGQVVFDHTTWDPRRHQARHLDGRCIDLTGIETQLLELFLSNPGRVLSRDDISRALRGHDWSPLDRTIDGHVARLRRKIEPPGSEAPVLIRSVRGVGYVFTTEPQVLATQSGPGVGPEQVSQGDMA